MKGHCIDIQYGKPPTINLICTQGHCHHANTLAPSQECHRLAYAQVKQPQSANAPSSIFSKHRSSTQHVDRDRVAEGPLAIHKHTCSCSTTNGLPCSTAASAASSAAPVAASLLAAAAACMDAQQEHTYGQCAYKQTVTDGCAAPTPCIHRPRGGAFVAPPPLLAAAAACTLSVCTHIVVTDGTHHTAAGACSRVVVCSPTRQTPSLPRGRALSWHPPLARPREKPAATAAPLAML